MTLGQALKALANQGEENSAQKFVAQDLSTIDGVLSTATHFMLRTYKAKGVAESLGGDERLEVS